METAERKNQKHTENTKERGTEFTEKRKTPRVGKESRRNGRPAKKKMPQAP